MLEILFVLYLVSFLGCTLSCFYDYYVRKSLYTVGGALLTVLLVVIPFINTLFFIGIIATIISETKILSKDISYKG